MQRLPAPGTQGTSGPGLTALGWAYIDTGRWDEALEAAAEAADLAEANQMELVAAPSDLIAATVFAQRADSGAARRRADRALANADLAESGLKLTAPGGPSESRPWLTAATFLPLRNCASCSARKARPSTTSSPTWAWPISPPPRSAPIGGWKDKTSLSGRLAI